MAVNLVKFFVLVLVSTATCFISDDIQNVTSVPNQENVTSVPKQEYSVRAETFRLDDYKSAFTLYNIGPVNRTFNEPLKVKITLDAAAYWAKNNFVFCLCFPSSENNIQNLGSIDYCKSEGVGKDFSRVCLERNAHNNLHTRSKDDPSPVPGILGFASPFAINQRSGNVDIFVAFGTPYENQNTPTVVINSNAFDPKTVTLRYDYIKKIKWSTESGVADYCQLGAYANDKILTVSFDDTKYNVFKTPEITVNDPNGVPKVPEAVVVPVLPKTTTPPTTTTTMKATTEDTASSSTPLYVCLGILGAVLILIIITCVLRYIQGVWFCGLLCFKKKEETEDGNFDKNENKLNDSKEANKPDGPIEVQVIEGKKVEENLPGSDEKPKMPPSEDKQQQSSQQPGNAPPPPPPILPPPPPPPSKDSPKKMKPAVTKDTTKDTKDTKDTTEEKDSDGETDGATTNAAPAPAEKKKERVPNMLLLPTKEDDTQSEAQIPSKRKTKVEKHNKEPAPTKFTQDPTIGGIATGKPAATTMKTGIKRTEAKTGIPKSETDLATEKGGTKGDKENFETRPTQQQTATMATGAAKTTKSLGPTQVGTQTTQGGGGTTVGEKTGIAKTTRVTGPTQIPSSAGTNETQIQTGATKTKTKPTQFPTQTTTQAATGKTQKFSTGTTQGRTGTTQKFSAGTTQAGTRTTQQGTTIATAYTQRASTGTTQGATRQTGETQNPDEADINIDPTQYAGTTVAGGGTTDPDPTQNPTATTVGKTSKTQLTGTAGTKTHTRTTQKQTKQTDDL